MHKYACHFTKYEQLLLSLFLKQKEIQFIFIIIHVKHSNKYLKAIIRW
jgi:hypothetical protein